MQFAPKTEKEIIDAKLLPRGAYDFEVLDAWEKSAKSSGNPMIELRLRLSDGKGRSKLLSDYLVAKKAEKLRHAALACGLEAKYESGSLSDSDFKGHKGRAKVGIEKGKNGFPDQNIIVDYLA